jgi:hypothetical protein
MARILIIAREWGGKERKGEKRRMKDGMVVDG